MKALTRNHWSPYIPTVQNPWTLDKVAHLHRRAGFGATWSQLHRDLHAGKDTAIEGLFSPNTDTAYDELVDSLREGVRTAMDRRERLQAYWIFRLVFDPDVLREKVTLFWHDHFATSNLKVADAELMLLQNDLLRRNALGQFAGLLGEVLRDPALLIWLDGLETSRQSPNENLGRELLELFTLGVGNYDEHDVRAAARCLTGLTLSKREPNDTPEVVFDLNRFDQRPKTLLGQSGNWGRDDLVRILLDQEACARFLCRKIYRTFVSDTIEPNDDVISELAEAMRTHKYSIAAVLKLIFDSEHFYSPEVIRSQVAAPVQWNISIIRMLEVPAGDIRFSAIDELCRRQGQQLFFPPNVSGWTQGDRWIEGMRGAERLLAARAWAFGDTELGLLPTNIEHWVRANDIAPDEAAQALATLMLQGDLHSVNNIDDRSIDWPSMQQLFCDLLCTAQFQLV